MAASTSPLSISVLGVDGLARSAGWRSPRSGSVGTLFQLTLSCAAGFHGNVVGEVRENAAACDQLAIADGGVILAGDQPVLNDEILDHYSQPSRRARDQKLPGLRRRLGERHRRDLDGFARDRRAL